MIKIIILLFILFTFSALANEERWIDLEFDSIPDAVSYEVELFQKIDNQKLVIDIYKSENPSWSKKVPAGKYYVRIRSIDNRNAPGPWSDEMFIPIKLPEVKILFPLKDAIIESNEDDSSHKVNFEWTSVNGANYYQFNLYNKDKQNIQSELVNTSSYQTYLSKRDSYFFEIIPLIDKNDEYTPKLSLNEFRLTYGRLPSPKPTLSTTTSSLVISWPEVDKDASYKLKIVKVDDSEKTISEKTITNTELILNKKTFTAGTYKLFISAEKPGHQDSTISQVVYEYEKDEIRVVVEKFTGIFDEDKRKVLKHSFSGYLSYPNIDYEFKNYENDTISKQKLSGEAIELGYSYRTNKTIFNSPILTNINTRIMNLADNYASALFIKVDTQILLEKKYNENLKFYPLAGIFINKTPALVINRLVINNAQEESFLTAGPSLGIKGEYRFNEQMVFKTHYLLRANLVPISSMPDNTQKMSLDHEIAVQAGYAFRTHLNLVLKGSILNEEVLSTPKTGNGSFASESDKNTITNSGFLLSFGVEWFF